MKHSRTKYYVQSDGTYVKGADGRSAGLTLAQVKAIGGKVR